MLEAYLNLVPLRGEAQGIGAGANSLFGKRPAEMTRTDAALLAGLLPNPSAGAKTLGDRACRIARSEEHTSELQSLMRISYAVFCLKKKTTRITTNYSSTQHITTKQLKPQHEIRT